MPLPEPTHKTIYDVLRMIVAGITWKTEAEQLEVQSAINTAEENNLFGTTGKMKL